MEKLIPYIDSTYVLGNYLEGTVLGTEDTLINKTDKNSCSCGDILFGRQTNIGDVLESAKCCGGAGDIEQDKGDQNAGVRVGGVFLS